MNQRLPCDLRACALRVRPAAADALLVECHAGGLSERLLAGRSARVDCVGACSITDIRFLSMSQSLLEVREEVLSSDGRPVELVSLQGSAPCATTRCLRDTSARSMQSESSNHKTSASSIISAQAHISHCARALSARSCAELAVRCLLHRCFACVHERARTYRAQVPLPVYQRVV